MLNTIRISFTSNHCELRVKATFKWQLTFFKLITYLTLIRSLDYLEFNLIICSRSHRGCSIKKMFTKFTGKHLCQSHFFDKIAAYLYHQGLLLCYVQRKWVSFEEAKMFHPFSSKILQNFHNLIWCPIKMSLNISLFYETGNSSKYLSAIYWL